ncbi:hypothetical protein NC99_10020 [Sunxiuqinia dokdonensis]|uniref:Uncharacterized protein n=1 Tax=Sunxiuqinia dokdonensis TaxID=1409788 RepID=A0A0L8VCI7_9BACT|nr:hypothetical protein NC99_10020 [Sunxiuqinia dokdonensis]
MLFAPYFESRKRSEYRRMKRETSSNQLNGNRKAGIITMNNSGFSNDFL